MPPVDRAVNAASASGSKSEPTLRGLFKAPLVGGVLAAIAASMCCAGPLVLLMLGISGSWIGNLRAFEPFRPLFMGLTALFLVLAFRKLYLIPQSCAADAPCASPASLRKQRATFWLVTLLVVSIVAFPWASPYILD